MNDFKEFITKYTYLPEDDWNLIKKEFQRVVFQKNEILLQEGNVCRYFYFFEKGLVRFCRNVDGEDVTKTFCMAPYCFTFQISFRNQTPAREDIQALEESIVWQITYEQYKKLEQITS